MLACNRASNTFLALASTGCMTETPAFSCACSLISSPFHGCSPQSRNAARIASGDSAEDLRPRCSESNNRRARESRLRGRERTAWLGLASWRSCYRSRPEGTTAPTRQSELSARRDPRARGRASPRPCRALTTIWSFKMSSTLSLVRMTPSDTWPSDRGPKGKQ